MNVNSICFDEMVTAFEKMLDEGHFPEVAWSRSGGFKSFSLFTYKEYYAHFARILDTRLKAAGWEGIFTRKRSKAFQGVVKSLIASITPEDVLNSDQRFGIQYYD